MNSENQINFPTNLQTFPRIMNISDQNLLPQNSNIDLTKMQSQNTVAKFNQPENININMIPNIQSSFPTNLNQNYPLMNYQGIQPLPYRQFFNMNANLLPKPYLFHHFYEQQSNSMFQQQDPFEDYNEKKEEAIGQGNDFREIAGDIILSLNCVDNPKMKNSEFYKFLTEIKSGKLEVKNNQIIKNENSIPESLIQIKSEEKEVDNLKSGNPFEYLDGFWEDMLKNENFYNPDSIINPNAFSNYYGHYDLKYNFCSKNEYLGKEDLINVAEKLKNNNSGKEEILKALEAEIQKNPHSSEGWRLLGKHYVENDQDDIAIICFLKGIQEDPYNIDSHLDLTVSCTNEIERSEAFDHFFLFFKFNPKYSQHVKGKEWNIDTDNELKQNMLKEIFSNLLKENYNDEKLLLAFGIFQILTKNFVDSQKVFEDIMKVNGETYDLLNKKGVSLQLQGRYSEAIECYYKAIEKFPKYVRAIANRGLAKISLKNYGEAIKDFNLSLQYNPEALHINEYIERCKLEMNDPNYFNDIKIDIDEAHEKFANIDLPE